MSFTHCFVLTSRGLVFLHSRLTFKSYERTGLAFKSERYGISQGVIDLMARVSERRRFVRMSRGLTWLHSCFGLSYEWTGLAFKGCNMW